MLNAIFHKGAYFLLPEESPTFEALQAELCSRELPAAYRMTPLLEDNRVRCFSVNKGLCMAPYFLTGYRDEPIDVCIEDPADVYPTQVERMTQEEYNARLRQVIEGYCKGCMSYKPLTSKVQSLNGHHEEISLNSVCFFRYEEKPCPRSFGQNLLSLGGGFMRFRYAERDAEAMRLKLKETLYIVYAAAEISVLPNGDVLLIVTPRKKEFLPAYLALAIGHYISALTGNYQIQPALPPDLSPDAILALAAPENRETFRKECRKYGVSIADLTWDGQDNGRVVRMLRELNRHALLHPLHAGENRAVLLLMDTSVALKTLRYHAPMLEAHRAALTVHGQFHSRRYAVSFDMPYETLD